MKLGGIAVVALAAALVQQPATAATSQASSSVLQPNKLMMLASARSSGKVFIFSPKSLRWYAYKDGRLIRSGRASGGAHYCRDVKRACRTPSGHYRITRKGGANCRSSRYPLGRGGARMDYCMFFSKYYAIHGSSNVPNYNASHGCIRVKPAAARWLHRHFLTIGTRVIVKSY